MKLQFKTNAFDLDVKDMAAEMGITKQFLYKIYDNKMNVSEKRAKEMLNILKHLDAEAEKNEEVNRLADFQICDNRWIYHSC